MSIWLGRSFRRYLGPLAVVLIAVAGSRCTAPAHRDALAAAIRERASLLRTSSSNDPIWKQVADGSREGITSAESSLAHGHRELALERLAEVWTDLGAGRYLIDRPESTRKDMAALEAEWKRLGPTLATRPGELSSHALDGVTPAAVRAQAEAAMPPVRIYYDASLDYARSTSPGSGFFYLGSAIAQRDFVARCRQLSQPTARTAPPLRSIARELDVLEDTLLASYRPPASIDLHPRFIEASSALKEARELDEAGLRYGAMLRYLQAVQLASRVRGAAPALDAAELSRRIVQIESRFAASGVDHSIGATYLQRAEEDLSAAPPESAHVAASAIVAQVLPRYLEALEPALPMAPRPPAEVTVTLVRWPYT